MATKTDAVEARDLANRAKSGLNKKSKPTVYEPVKTKTKKKKGY